MKTLNLTSSLYDYLLAVSLREHEVQKRLREYTATLRSSGMQIAPEQGQLMALLIQLMGAKRAIEVGVFTGYSALSVALALPADGRLIACDINTEWTSTARDYWRQAGVDEKIELRLGPGLETLDALLHQGQDNSFDFAFIDADKGNYKHYYERLLELIKPGGLIIIDNMLWSGAVIDEQDKSADTEAIRQLNQQLHKDPRIAISLLPVGDGLTLALKLCS